MAPQIILAILGDMSARLDSESGVEKLLAAAGGSPSAVAKRLSTPERRCSRQLVEYWLHRGYVPGTWAPLVAEEFDIPLHELNPRVYPQSLS